MRTLQKMQNPPRTAVEVYKLLPEGTLCEVINNTIYMAPQPSHEHQRVSRKLITQISLFVEEHKLGEVFEPIDVFLNTENVFQPGIIFISKNNSGRLIAGSGFEGVPDLVIEILSPFNRKHDLVKKRKIYEQVGVKEYWVADPISKYAFGFKLRDGGFEELPMLSGRIKPVLLKRTFTF